MIIYGDVPAVEREFPAKRIRMLVLRIFSLIVVLPAAGKGIMVPAAACRGRCARLGLRGWPGGAGRAPVVMDSRCRQGRVRIMVEKQNES